jgi:hypothetical protein
VSDLVDPATVIGEELFRAEERDAAQREAALGKPLVDAAGASRARIEHFGCRQFICRVITSHDGDGGFLHEIEGVLRGASREGARNPRQYIVRTSSVRCQYGSRRRCP